jgi:hypothetical protein
VNGIPLSSGGDVSVVCRVSKFHVRIGGNQHSGWLPAGAANPLPTPVRDVDLNLEIEFDGSGYLLIVASTDGSVYGDTWHQTEQEAQEEASAVYGVPKSAWTSGQSAAG